MTLGGVSDARGDFEYGIDVRRRHKRKDFLSLFFFRAGQQANLFQQSFSVCKYWYDILLRKHHAGGGGVLEHMSRSSRGGGGGHV